MTEVTRLIASVNNGEDGAAENLFEAVYQELRIMADFQMSKENSGHTLQTTALINEAFLRLFGHGNDREWENRAHFFGAAAEAMRRILVDHARRKQAQKRKAGKAYNHSLNQLADQSPNFEEVLDISDVLDQLGEVHPEKAEVVKLRYFAGLTIAQTAELLDISVPTANRYWAFARAWLFDRIQSSRVG